MTDLLVTVEATRASFAKIKAALVYPDGAEGQLCEALSDATVNLLVASENLAVSAVGVIEAIAHHTAEEGS